MYKLRFLRTMLIILLSTFFVSFAQYRVNLLKSEGDVTVLKMELVDYSLKNNKIDGKLYTQINLLNGVYNQEKGNPNLPSIVKSIIISDDAKMDYEVLSIKTEKVKVNKILPSKGSISRKIDPSSVPYEFSEVYKQDSNFPSYHCILGTPYILRDFRANTVTFNPFSYNPIKNELEIRKEIIVKVFPTEEKGVNAKVRKRSKKQDSNFQDIYNRKFLNYPETRYTPVDDEGDMLIISYGDFIDAIEPLAEWKNKKGIRTEIVDVADIGNSSAIKTFVKNYYDSTDLKYLLLVGDYQQVPNAVSISPEDGSSDPSDSKYGCIEGNDSYVEVFVGRFSGTNASHIGTQVEKVLHYERELDESDTWLNAGLGSADQSEADDKAVIDHITKELKDFTYTTVNYYQGDYNSDNQIVGWTNDGLGVFGVSTHANETSIAGLKASSASKMNNEGMYPYNFTLGCDPGNFTFSNTQDCLGEALLKRNKGGFIGAFMASISQPWYEPYAALREFFDIITEQYPSNKKVTYGGIAMSGCMKMIDDYSSQGPWVADTWILFGDPSLAVYTDLPSDITVSHPSTVGLGVQTVTVSGTDGLTVALYSKEQGIQVKGVISGGSVNLSIDVTTLDSIYVTGTGHNLQTYEGVIAIESGPYLSVASPVASSEFNYQENVEIEWVVGGGASISNIKLEYSIDNKSTWNVITESVSSSSSSYSWSVPDIFGSDSCFIKASEVGGSLEGVSGQFKIIRDPDIYIEDAEISIGVKPDDVGNSLLKIENNGKGKLNYKIKNTGNAGSVLINELFVSHSAFFDGLEIWNKGSEIDLSGWSVSWIDSDNSSGDYAFADGFIMGEGKTLVLTDEEDGVNDSTLYVGKNLLWSTDSSVEVSVTLLNSDNEAVDFVKTEGSDTPTPNGTEWNGAGVACTNDRIFRNKNEDNDDASDWSHGDGELSVNEINPGQSNGNFIESWLTINKYEGDIKGLDEDELTLTFNATGLDEGDYYDTLIITHNDNSKSNPITIPCYLYVGETAIFNKVDNIDKCKDFKVGPLPAIVNRDNLHFRWDGKNCKRIKISICDNLGNVIKDIESNGKKSSFEWDLIVDNGYHVSPGSYLVIVTLTLFDGSLKSYKTLVGIKAE